MSLRKDVERLVKVTEFHRTVEQLLTPEDRDYLFYALKEYNTYKSVAKLMLALNSCLDTPEKLDLLPYVRDLIPKHDQKKFDSLAPYNRMAHPFKSVKASSSGQEPPSSTAASQDSVRTVLLQRPKGTNLGFSIRGGREHDLGIYISHVDSFSLAEKSGLQVGDQIVNVNRVSFESITHSSAVLVLKSHDEFRMVVRNVGMVPGQRVARNSFIWVDASGKPVEEVDGEEQPTQPMAEERAAGDRLLASSDRHKVVLHGDKKRSLGLSIRGGSEYSLGIYISSVDKDSQAEESGLQVGDQILDVNGHSFLSILHQEAVTILRSYPTLILTIKSLGRLPTVAMPQQVQWEKPPELSLKNRDDAPTSPQEKHSSLLKALTSPLSPTKKTPPQLSSTSKKAPRQLAPPSSYHHSGMIFRPKKSSRDSRLSQLKVRRSRSFNPPALGPIARTQSAYPGGLYSLDLAGAPHTAMRLQTDSERSSTLPRLKKQQKSLAVSPLATKNTRATVSPLETRTHPTHTTSPPQTATSTAATHTPKIPVIPTSPPGHGKPRTGGDTRRRVEDDSHPRFFAHGMGTQLMLASASSQAKQLLLDRARKLLGSGEVETLLERLKKYERSRGVGELVDFLIGLLDTPEKIQLLNEIRSVLHPSDLAQFDEQVSPHEVAALHQRASDHTSEEPTEEVASHYNMVVSAIQSHSGQRALRRSRDEDSRPKHPDLGAFAGDAAQSVLHRAAREEPDLAGVQTKESFLAWHEDYDMASWERGPSFPPQTTSSNPVIVEMPKNGPFIGLTIEGGVDTPTPEIMVREVREGGAAHKDGFLQPGFEIVEVDGVKIKGKTHEEAATTIAQAFNSERPTIELIVIPN